MKRSAREKPAPDSGIIPSLSALSDLLIEEKRREREIEKKEKVTVVVVLGGVENVEKRIFPFTAGNSRIRRSRQFVDAQENCVCGEREKSNSFRSTAGKSKKGYALLHNNPQVVDNNVENFCGEAGSRSGFLDGLDQLVDFHVENRVPRDLVFDGVQRRHDSGMIPSHVFADGGEGHIGQTPY